METCTPAQREDVRKAQPPSPSAAAHTPQISTNAATDLVTFSDHYQ